MPEDKYMMLEAMDRLSELKAQYRKEGIFDSYVILHSVLWIVFVRLFYSSPYRAKEKWNKLLNIPSEKDQLQYLDQILFPEIEESYQGNENIISLFNENKFFHISPSLYKETIDVVNQIFEPLEQTASYTEVGTLLFEKLLSLHEVSGQNEGVFIPQHIIKFMVALADVKVEESIFDPNSRMGGFLVEAYKQKLIKSETEQASCEVFDEDGFPVWPEVKTESIKKNAQEKISGWVRSNDELHLCMWRLLFYGMENISLVQSDFISEEPCQSFDVILSNPPFGAKVHSQYHARIGSPKSEIQFIDRISEILKPGGRGMIIVPENFLTDNSTAFGQCRQFLLKENRLEAVISLPPGIFQPSTNGKAAILFFVKDDKGTEEVWFYELENDGFSLDYNRRRLKGTPLKDAVELYQYRENKRDNKRENGFFVKVQEIEQNNWNLSFNRYRDFEYLPTDYQNPAQILEEIIQQEKEFAKLLDNLKSKVKWRV